MYKKTFRLLAVLFVITSESCLVNDNRIDPAVVNKLNEKPEFTPAYFFNDSNKHVLLSVVFENNNLTSKIIIAELADGHMAYKPFTSGYKVECLDRNNRILDKYYLGHLLMKRTCDLRNPFHSDVLQKIDSGTVKIDIPYIKNISRIVVSDNNKEYLNLTYSEILRTISHNTISIKNDTLIQ